MTQNAKSLSVIDGESLLALDIEPPKFIVAKLIPTGLHLLTGSPKIGKSWLALWLCNQVSSGGKVWEFDTQNSGTRHHSPLSFLQKIYPFFTDISSEQFVSFSVRGHKQSMTILG